MNESREHRVQKASLAARRELLAEFGAVTSTQLTARGVQPDAAPIAVVTEDGQTLYPVFQFGPDGSPRPAVSQVAGLLVNGDATAWGVALWFAIRTGWLDNERPVDLLDRDPAAVVEAARMSMAEPFY